jgi:periplasmic protein TonB
MPKTTIRRRFARPAAAAALSVSLSLSLSALADGGDLAVVTRVDFEFPREAVVAGVNNGKVKARVTVDATGEVARVEILDASPRRVFDRQVVKTLSQWKFVPGANGRSKEIDVDFKMQ